MSTEVVLAPGLGLEEVQISGRDGRRALALCSVRRAVSPMLWGMKERNAARVTNSPVALCRGRPTGPIPTGPIPTGPIVNARSTHN